AIASDQLFYQLPHNLVLHRRPQGWTLTVATTTQATTEEPQLYVDSLPLGLGTTVLPGGRWQVTVVPSPGRPEMNLERWQIMLDADAIRGDLHFRVRQAGDRLRPAGGIGSRRVQDIMVDLKLPRELRAHWPLLADGFGLLWLPGLVVADHAHPTPDTRTYLVVTLEETTPNASGS
ncbi:MAG TPA: tRNA lysidine(34) synthetase TilS, partial [Herpetosiphonaceae bacterium]|nr:tRNA lysidine(34) synthetase TilS [Herpetosiphonaceae bacterium]